MLQRTAIFVMAFITMAALAACGNGGADSAGSVGSDGVTVINTPVGAVDDPSVPAPTATTGEAAVPEEQTADPTAADAQPTEAPNGGVGSAADLNSLQVSLEAVAQGLDTPIGMASVGDGTGRLFVLEKGGVIRVIEGGVVLDGAFLDISSQVGSGGSEQGLLGLAFHPDYAENGFFFVNYTDTSGNTVVSRFVVTGDPNRADPASEQIVLTQNQPAGNHNGGHLVFGPDGYLYIGLGDGGGAGDTYGNGQNLQTWLGTMLRIGVDELPYSIPPDNPYVDDPNVPDEIWAYGLRNPWRYSFDRETQDLYIADVGQNAYEEVNFQPASSGGGENYGWPIMEGFHCFRGNNCDQTGLVLPVAEYSHDQGCSITGGYVYRGQAYPALNGVYFFGDYCSGIMWGLARMDDGSWLASQLLTVDGSIASFGEDESGEVYAVDMRGGTIYRISTQ